MEATVVRNGSHQGQAFVEVKLGQSHYAVPVNAELPVGTVVNITVTVAEVPPAPGAELAGTDVSAVPAPATPEPAAKEKAPVKPKAATKPKSE